MLRKALAYAYPTSEDAKAFGFYQEGCYTVEVIEDGRPPVAVAGFRDKAGAFHQALRIDLPWSRLSIPFPGGREREALRKGAGE